MNADEYRERIERIAKVCRDSHLELAYYVAGHVPVTNDLMFRSMKAAHASLLNAENRLLQMIGKQEAPELKSLHTKTGGSHG